MSSIPVSNVFGSNTIHCNSSSFDCSQRYPPCSIGKRFDFPSLWNITQNYVASCPNGPWPWLFDTGTPQPSLALKNEACEIIAGAHFKVYPAADIWMRLTTWKFPLFQLVATSPRPPLSLVVEAFTIFHLLGDPIGSLTDLLRKIEGCQRRAVLWRATFCPAESLPSSQQVKYDATEGERLWKAFAIIIDSYDEWGSQVGDKAGIHLKTRLQELSRDDALDGPREAIYRVCKTTAGALAADRSTRFLPVAVAQAFFIGNIAIAMIRTKSIAKSENPSTYINIEMHSIGFTALFFWLISAVILTSIIGASQTCEAMPRILVRFRNDLAKAGFVVDLPDHDQLHSKDRTWTGGIYTWQPERSWQPIRSEFSFPAYKNARDERRGLSTLSPGNHRAKKILLSVWPWVYLSLPLSIFSAAIITGMGASFAVPPIGWSCRSKGESIVAGIWLASYALSYLGGIAERERLFHITFVKDALSVAGTMGWVIATQIGIYNKCDCYTKYGRAGLALPQQPAASDILRRGLELGGSYTVIVTLGVLFQLVLVPLLLLWRYHAAFQVFLQRDDGKSNLNGWPRHVIAWPKVPIAWVMHNISRAAQRRGPDAQLQEVRKLWKPRAERHRTRAATVDASQRSRWLPESRSGSLATWVPL